MPRATLPALVLLLVAAVWLVATAGPPLAGEPELPLSTVTGDGTGAPAELAPLRAAGQRTEVSHVVPSAAAVPEASLARLRVRVTDLDGVPAPGVRVLAGPPRHVLNGFGETDARGELEVLWRSRAWPAELLVELRGTDGSSLTGLRRFQIARGGVARLELALTAQLLPKPSADVDLTPAQEDGARHPSALSWGSIDAAFVLDALGRRETIIALTDEPGRKVRREFEPHAFRVGRGAARFLSGSARGDFGNAYFESSVGEPIMQGSAGAVPPQRARAFGAVVDERGLPARGVRVAVEDRAGGIRALARTDEHGRFALGFVAGDVRLRAGGVERGSTAEVALAGGVEFEWNPSVRRLALVRGELPGSVSSARIEGSALVRGPLGDTLHISTLDTTGGVPFELTCPPGATFTAHVTQLALPRGAVVERFDGLVPGVAWSPRLAPTCEVSLEPRDGPPVGLEFPAASEVRVFEAGGARGVRIPAWRLRGAELRFPLASGAWALEVGTGGAFWTEPVPIDATPFDAVELGPIDFGPRCDLVLPAHGDPAAVQAAMVTRADTPYDSVVLPGSRPYGQGDAIVPLPPGDYVLQHEDGTSAPFTLAPGTRFVVEWRPIAAVRAPRGEESSPEPR